MSAYVVAEVEVKDRAAYESYLPIAAEALKIYGGKFIARGGVAEALEGEPAKPRVVIIEFASAEQARRWHSSPEYAPGLKMRQAAADARLLLVDGL
ncbi:uncharacterized protein (DUF1330 family) [Trinickia symbiotica]|uniref:DUF1330 domain-containing protein n=1 Tax=Trinickia symbiotica TaxID=863227 RepID=A0A2N7WTF7_9BURK|nr:DUF1330 domain-containing protein [Trinickia symbiotica]PMS32622.1 DUF1330 domain-containing protein [Trinickia symbiotica]PPK41019.1 uncharacterized protein (DUF1330 family) [Trinickia symbiotica]